MILAVVFGVFSAILLAGAVYYLSSPTETEKVTDLWNYRSRASYDVVAYLKSNNFYNRTTLRPEEGTFYSRIIDRLHIVFRYDFESNRPVSGSVDYYVVKAIKTPAWEKVLETTPTATLPLNGTSNGFQAEHTIEIDDFKEIIKTFDGETGTNTNDFNITYQYYMTIRAESGSDRVDDRISPSIDISVRPRSKDGDIIVIGSQDYTYPGSIAKKETVLIVSVFGIYRYQYRYLTLGGFLVASVISAFLAWSYVKTSPKREKSITDLMKPYREVVAEAMEPIHRRGEIVITMSSLDDLAKVSDNLAKPILHTRDGRTHTFYLYDGPNRYEYNEDEKQ